MKVKQAFKKIGEKLQNFEKKFKKDWENFTTLHLGKGIDNLWNLKINFVNV